MSFSLESGPHSVGYSDVRLTDLTLPEGGNFGGATGLTTTARIYYPSATGGDNAAATTDPGKWPGIAYAHGRFFAKADNITATNHLRATGVIRHLVSHGFVVISINMTLVDRFQSYLLKARATIVNAGLRYLKSDVEIGGVALADLVDGDRLGTIGHSRGGAAAVAADYFDEPDIDISAVACISPVEGLSIATDKPIFILYGALDDDVSSGDPVKIFERCSGWKSFAYLDGASHFHFSDDLTVDMAVLSRARHAEVAGAYFSAFFLAMLKGDRSHDEALIGDLPFGDPEVRMTFQHMSGVSKKIDEFETTLDDPNALGGARSVAGFNLAISGKGLDLPRQGFFGDVQRGLILRWDSGATPVYETRFPALELLSTQILAFRLSQLRAIGVSALLEDISVAVELEDITGQTATVRSDSIDFSSIPFASRNPYWFTRRNIPANSLIYVQTARKDVFGSCRLPLAMFKMANSRFDLGQVIALRLRFPSLAGAVVMDDICIEEGVKASV